MTGFEAARRRELEGALAAIVRVLDGTETGDIRNIAVMALAGCDTYEFETQEQGAMSSGRQTAC